MIDMPPKERSRAFRRKQMQQDKAKRGVRSDDRALRAPKTEAYQRNLRSATRAELDAGWWYE